MNLATQKNTAKKTFWGAFLFYFLIAFEFFYMASPFAVYFYSVYKPALNFFNKSPSLGWLISFFMPHAIVETSSVFINIHNIVGAIFAVLGFLGFCIGAFQIYYYKLAKKGVVTGGIYNYVRHPQYAFFILCSFGLLILWPRYIVLIMYVTMVFVYYILAKVEEKECEEKFGESYKAYREKTNMFLPFSIPFLKSVTKKFSSLPTSKDTKFLAVFLLYSLTLTLSILAAKGINLLAINSLYATYNAQSVTLSVSKNNPTQINKIVEIALSNEDVYNRVIDPTEEETKYLNYVLPSEWYVAEIPMNPPAATSPNKSERIGHKLPSDYNKNHYKIIFTKVQTREGQSASGKHILTSTYLREPLLEVWVDIRQNEVIKVLEMPEEIMYDNIPVALY